MLQWLLSLLGIKPRPAPPAAPPRPPARPRPAPPPESTEAPALAADARDFLLQVVSDSEPSDLQGFSGDDRLFLSGILKRIRENDLEIPLLPQAAVEISRLLANPSSHMDDFVRVLEADPALSVEVLRIANSAFYGFGGATQSVHNAVARIGLNQIRGLIVVAHLHGKVLRGGVLQTEAHVLSDLSLALAQLGQDLSGHLGLDRDSAYTRGVLSHVEHFIVMGTVTEISREHQRRLVPTQEALVEVFRRFGARVRELAAHTWGLEALMVDGAEAPPVQGVFVQLARAVAADWTGEPVPFSLEAVPPERLAASLRRVRPGAGAAGAAA